VIAHPSLELWIILVIENHSWHSKQLLSTYLLIASVIIKTRSIIVSEMTKSMHRHYMKFGEKINELIGLKMFPENRHWRCRRDVQRQSVPQSGSSDRKSSIADGWKTGAWDNKRWCRCRAETLTSLVSRWLMEFLSKVRRSCLVLAFVYQNTWCAISYYTQFESYSRVYLHFDVKLCQSCPSVNFHRHSNQTHQITEPTQPNP